MELAADCMSDPLAFAKAPRTFWARGRAALDHGAVRQAQTERHAMKTLAAQLCFPLRIGQNPTLWHIPFWYP